VFSTNTRILGYALGLLKGRGRVRCEFPLLPLLPNDFDIEVAVWNKDQSRRFCHVLFPQVFSINPPESLEALGCGLPVEIAERGIVFGQARWSRDTA
jgi:hypothetical protein